MDIDSPLPTPAPQGNALAFAQDFVWDFWVRWLAVWFQNRDAILKLTVINVAITLGNELLVRSVLSMMHVGIDGFFVFSSNGALVINRQSAINVCMTLFASLLGGPVYFISTRVKRGVYFVGFGLFNSVLSQFIVSLLKDGSLLLSAIRLLFDAVYTLLVKFSIFELFRGPILAAESAVLRVGFLRVSQDILMTTLKVIIISLFGLGAL